MIALPGAFFEQENEPMDVFKHAKKLNEHIKISPTLRARMYKKILYAEIT